MRAVSFVLALAAGIAAGNMSSENAAAQKQRELQSPGAFLSMADRATRSKALFLEAAKVITDPRCMNCHPAGDHPLQGDDHHIHQPAAFRGEANNGGPGLRCATCHSLRNFTLSVGEASYQSIPGHPRWALAPLEMAWEGKSVGDICRQIKDPTRNGGRSLALLHEHFAKDDFGGMGLEPRCGADAGTRNPGAAWNSNPGLDRDRRRMSMRTQRATESKKIDFSSNWLGLINAKKRTAPLKRCLLCACRLGKLD